MHNEVFFTCFSYEGLKQKRLNFFNPKTLYECTHRINYNMLFKLSVLSLLIALHISCTEIIDVSTIAAEPQLVVEANIVLNQPAVVLLSKTKALNQTNDFEKVSQAKIQISDNNGKTEYLIEDEHFSGKYVSKTMKGEQGKTYSLRIEYEGKIITSSSKMPLQVPIDSFTVTNTLFPGGPTAKANVPAPFYEIVLKFSDPLHIENFYRFDLYYNNVKQDRNNIASDRFNNGKQIEVRLILFNDSVKQGDKIVVEMLCIDKQVFNYFESMRNSGGGPRNASSPANPYTNLNGALLGYFSAHTLEKRSWILKQ